MQSGWTLDLLGDAQDVGNREGIHWSRLLHFGAELGTKILTKDTDYGLVAGINDGYSTYGLFAELWFVRLELAKYTAELDRDPGTRGDARYAFSLRSSMTF